jgi:2-methylcitrate dehydratase PrpD
MSTSTNTQDLIEFIRTTRFSDLPSDVVAATKENITDFFAVAIGGTGEEAVKIAGDYVTALGGSPQASIPVTGLRTNVRSAALLLGVMGHVLDFDDTHMPTILHGTTPVTSAALPVAQWQGLGGERLITAYAVGFEAAARTALAMDPSHYDTGWHVTGTAGAIGAAAATAQLLGLDVEQIRNALGIAATQAAGHREHFGTMTKSLGVGKAAANGVSAGLLASRGYDAATDPLEGRRGMFSVMSGHVDSQALGADLGSRWELRNSGLKPFPCGVVTHPAIDAVLSTMRQAKLDADNVEEVTITVHPLVFELTNKPATDGGLEAKFSITFTTAVAICHGALVPSDFTAQVAADPDIAAMRARIRVQPDDGYKQTEATAVIRTKDGQTHHHHVSVGLGMAGNPMTVGQRVEKAHLLIDPILGADACDQILDQMRDLEQSTTLEALIASTIS